jgi:DNA mismatch repair protein MutS
MIFDDYVLYTDKYKDVYGEKTVVFIEIGSFFEIYGVNNQFEITGANMTELGNLLNIQVSRKNKSILENSRDNPMMAGFPNHSLKKFIDILVNHDYTTVIIEQVTPPPNPKREVTQIISPSTYIEHLSSHNANVLMILYIEQTTHWKTLKSAYAIGVTTVDLSTSRTSCFESYVDNHSLNEELVRLCLFYNPKELVVTSIENIDIFVPGNIYFHDKIAKLHNQYSNKNYQTTVVNKVFSERGFLEPIEYLNMERLQYALISFVYMLDFVYSHNESLLKNIKRPVIEDHTDNLVLTNNALYQLDIVGKKNCLMDILNNCVTAIGKRYANRMITNPIKNVKKLNDMYDNISCYIQDDMYIQCRTMLKQIMDIERIVKKQHIQPFQFANVYTSLLEIQKLYKLIKNKQFLTKLINQIENSIIIEKASKYNLNNIEENIFCKDIDQGLDVLQDQVNDIIKFFDDIFATLASFVKLERSDKDGIVLTTTNKKYNDLCKIFNNQQYTAVKYRQNHVRVSNKEIDEKNDEYMFLKSEMKKRVAEKFTDFCNDFVRSNEVQLDKAVGFLEKVDYYSNNAYNAIRFGLNKPEITKNACHIRSKQLRHPIIEYVQKDTQYIPNDIDLNDDNRGIILYGINAAGKSSLMKSIGIAVIMAQCGMFVASESFQFFPYSNVHTRILNNDNLYKKQSTFTVEMSEIRNILNHSDENSLVIGDELCSGTESISAISLVTAGVIRLAKQNTSFIFATHLHELNNIDDIKSLTNVKIKHLSVKYDSLNNYIVYDRILKDGAGDTLYGLEVCKSLDLDPEFMMNANRIRKQLLKMSENIVNNTKSIYNSSLYKDICYICNRNAEDIHHIKHQVLANKKKMIDHFHKNSKFNLVPLCKQCHDTAHNGNLNIEGYIETSDGTKLKYNTL